MMPKVDVSRGVAIALLLAVLGWAYWSSLIQTAERWSTDSQYSHGWLVPLFSAYLLYRNRTTLLNREAKGSWWGFGLIAVAFVFRLLGFWFYLPWIEVFSLLVSLAGLFWSLAGWQGLKASASAVLFLGFMIPLPFRFQQILGGNLQTIATKASTYILQTVGIPAIAEGNIILLTDGKIGVVEACNGLGMLVTFFALATAFALVIRRHWVYTLLMILAAAPIAVGANVIRIAVTGILYESGRVEGAKMFFHDLAGWAMMPLGVAMLAALLFFADSTWKRVPATA